MLFRFLMISLGILTFKTFLTQLTIKLIFPLLFFMFIFNFWSWSFVLPFEVLFNFSKSFFLQLLLNNLHLFFLLLLLFLLLNFLLSFLFFFFLNFYLILSEPRISFLHISYQVLNSFNVSLLLSLPLLFVFLLHLSSHPSVVGLSCVPFLAPDKTLIGGEVIPILIESQHFIFSRVGISKTLKFSKLFFKILSGVKSFFLFNFYFFKNFPIDSIKSFRPIFKTIEAACSKIEPNIKSKTILLKIFLAHIFFVEQHLLPIRVVPCPFVGIGQNIVCFCYLNELMLGVLAGIFIRMVFYGHFAITLLDLSWSSFLVHVQDLVVAPLHPSTLQKINNI